MDYKRFYEYLETRPLAEIKVCMDNVVGVFNRQNTGGILAPTVVSSQSTDLKDDELERLRVAQRVWTQQAVWSKFGTGDDCFSSKQQLALATSQLMTEPKVAEFVVSVNRIIDKDSKAHVTSLSHSSSAKVAMGGFAAHRLIRDRYISLLRKFLVLNAHISIFSHYIVLQHNHDQ